MQSIELRYAIAYLRISRFPDVQLHIWGLVLAHHPGMTQTDRKISTVTAKDLHSYEPKNGHGLKHDPFNAIIAPRPIGWISSRDTKGNINLAPYSFFNAFCYHPPIIGFSSTNWKDSAGNIQDTGEFVLQARQRAAGGRKPGRVRVQADANHPAAGRRR